MSRSSRFSKLEDERAAEQAPGSGASLERFAAEPEPGQRTEPADPMQPGHGAERLRRFESDGADGLGLDRDPLASLAALECLRCAVVCGKFETVCHSCGASLTTPEARAHNLQRAQTQRAVQALGVAAERERLEASLREGAALGQTMEAAAHGMARELGGRYAGDRKRTHAWQWWLAAALFFVLAAVLSRFGLRLLAFALGSVCLLSRTPAWMWTSLGQKVRSRGGW